MLVVVILIALGLYSIFSGTKERTGCGCLGVLAAAALFVMFFITKIMM